MTTDHNVVAAALVLGLMLGSGWTVIVAFLMYRVMRTRNEDDLYAGMLGSKMAAPAPRRPMSIEDIPPPDPNDPDYKQMLALWDRAKKTAPPIDGTPEELKAAQGTPLGDDPLI